MCYVLLISLETETSPVEYLVEASWFAGCDDDRTALGNDASTLVPHNVVCCVLVYGEIRVK